MLPPPPVARSIVARSAGVGAVSAIPASAKALENRCSTLVRLAVPKSVNTELSIAPRLRSVVALRAVSCCPAMVSNSEAVRTSRAAVSSARAVAASSSIVRRISISSSSSNCLGPRDGAASSSAPTGSSGRRVSSGPSLRRSCSCCRANKSGCSNVSTSPRSAARNPSLSRAAALSNLFGTTTGYILKLELSLALPE